MTKRDIMTKRDKKLQNPNSIPKEFKRQKIIASISEGKTTGEVAKELGVSRQQVSRILNSDETKEIIRHGENEIKLMISEAARTIKDALMQRNDPTPNAMTNALKAAEKVLRTHGIFREKYEVELKLPTPTVIERPSGKEVEMGYLEQKEEEE